MGEDAQLMEIAIFGYAAGAGACCDPSSGCCAPSPVDVAERVAGMVSRQYGDRFQVKYVDTFSIDALDYSDVMQAIQEQNLPLPVLAVAGRPRLWGDFHLYDVAKLLKEVAAGEQAD
jgi:disulfide oxidoreductase YuzD